jgi:Cysteine-rich CPCC
MTDIDPAKIEMRQQWFQWYVDNHKRHSIIQPPRDGVIYCCPCCKYKTLDERGGYEICEVCFWEDDGQDEQDANVVRGGSNGVLSLTQARANFQNFGACEAKHLNHVRNPLPEEM